MGTNILQAKIAGMFPKHLDFVERKYPQYKLCKVSTSIHFKDKRIRCTIVNVQISVS